MQTNSINLALLASLRAQKQQQQQQQQSCNHNTQGPRTLTLTMYRVLHTPQACCDRRQSRSHGCWSMLLWTRQTWDSGHEAWHCLHPQDKDFLLKSNAPNKPCADTCDDKTQTKNSSKGARLTQIGIQEAHNVTCRNTSAKSSLALASGSCESLPWTSEPHTEPVWADPSH
jgi:hypothetical protein